MINSSEIHMTYANGYKYEDINGIIVKSNKTDIRTQNYNFLLNWLKENVVFIKSTNYNHNSANLRTIIQRATGRYVNNYDVKFAFAEIGVKGIKDVENGTNYYYPISERWVKEIISNRK